MATLQSLAMASPVSHHLQQPRSSSGLVSWAVHQSAQSSFNGRSLHLPRLHLPRLRLTTLRRNSRGPVTMMVKPKIQFIQGTDEQTVPDVRLTKSKDGTNGMAIFRFEQPSVFDSSGEVGDITGFYMIDEEGVLQSVDVNAKFVNGKPAGIEAKYIMRTPREWDRFMRFMERYSDENGLQFIKK
ncbi:photosystem II reaction center PSB28 protein, chloroplastic [Corylus avellana]|uniref:photosystem II reaction center PSB28 protein, chloroplastic n=1 Tax=Corylus avellana TaxID=13451 RepID=UPI001E1EC451|nr:photosystem II reaction center PSB28 protein, chloroplastic [Corylus avellana]